MAEARDTPGMLEVCRKIQTLCRRFTIQAADPAGKLALHSNGFGEKTMAAAVETV
ncbi:MAG: hypothetical protein QG586_1153, partial [Pseudomonadota bacterium]|nr:hypothetical protein [Pseudomonadota bacterium]